MLDIAIFMKFLTLRVSLQSGHPNFRKNFCSPKMTAIWNFRFFLQNLQNTQIAKHKNAYISKTVLDRAIAIKFLTRRVSLRNSVKYFIIWTIIINPFKNFAFQ